MRDLPFCSSNPHHCTDWRDSAHLPLVYKSLKIHLFPSTEPVCYLCRGPALTHCVSRPLPCPWPPQPGAAPLKFDGSPTPPLRLTARCMHQILVSTQNTLKVVPRTRNLSQIWLHITTRRRCSSSTFPTRTPLPSPHPHSFVGLGNQE